MVNSKPFMIFLFVLLGLPVPFSLLSWIGTIMSVANMGMVNWGKFSERTQMISGLIAMLLAGTYLITYIISLLIALKKGKVSPIIFLPVAHILLFVIAMTVWGRTNA